jgi:hypothetical protein
MVLVGAELELLLEKNGRPMEWSDWRMLMEAVQKQPGVTLEPKNDVLTGELMGFEIPGKGVLTCDSSAAQAELAADPGNGKNEAMENLRYLYRLLENSLDAIGANIRWGSQYPGRITEEDYWRRVARKGLYSVVRKIWGWKHYEMHLSVAFQPAIDIEPQRAAAYLNAIHATSPIAIAWLGGSSPSMGNETEVYYEYRMHGWRRMLTGNSFDTEIIGVRYSHSPEDYIKALLGLKARVLTVSEGGYKAGQPVYFDPEIRGHDVISGTDAHIVTGIKDPRNDVFESGNIKVSGQALLNQMDWWTFWDARWRFKQRQDGSFEKSYIEIRNIGTPSSFEKLGQILDFFLALRDSYDIVNKLASEHGIWDNMDLARDSAIQTGQLPPNHMAFAQLLIAMSILTKNRLHGV